MTSAIPISRIIAINFGIYQINSIQINLKISMFLNSTAGKKSVANSISWDKLVQQQIEFQHANSNHKATHSDKGGNLSSKMNIKIGLIKVI